MPAAPPRMSPVVPELPSRVRTARGAQSTSIGQGPCRTCEHRAAPVHQARHLPAGSRRRDSTSALGAFAHAAPWERRRPRPGGPPRSRRRRRCAPRRPGDTRRTSGSRPTSRPRTRTSRTSRRRRMESAGGPSRSAAGDHNDRRERQSMAQSLRSREVEYGTPARALTSAARAESTSRPRMEVRAPPRHG